MVTEDTIFASRLLALRRERGRSQPALGKQVGTSGAIIDRYERSEIAPSIGWRGPETGRCLWGHAGLFDLR